MFGNLQEYVGPQALAACPRMCASSAAAPARLEGKRREGKQVFSLLVGGAPSPCVHVGVGFHTILSPKCLPGVEHIRIKKYLSELLVLALDALTCTHLPDRKFLRSDESKFTAPLAQFGSDLPPA